MTEANEAFRLGQAKKDFILLSRARLVHSELESAKYDDGIDEGYDPTLHAQRAHDHAQECVKFCQAYQ